jgi:hypothetical protein
MLTMGNILNLIPNKLNPGHHPRGVKVFLGERQILPIKKIKIDFFDRYSKCFSTFSTP